MARLYFWGRFVERTGKPVVSALVATKARRKGIDTVARIYPPTPFQGVVIKARTSVMGTYPPGQESHLKIRYSPVHHMRQLRSRTQIPVGA